LKRNHFVFEIIVVNDGSRDNSANTVRFAKTMYPKVNITLLNNVTNMGKGYSITRGLLKARHRTVAVIDADCSVSMVEIEKYDWNFIRKTPIIKGQRRQVVRQPLHRIILGKGFKVMVWLMTGLYMDTQCPFSILNLPKRFYKNLEIDGFGIDVEILLLARSESLKIVPVIVDYYDISRSSVKPKHYLEMFREVKKIKKKFI